MEWPETWPLIYVADTIVREERCTQLKEDLTAAKRIPTVEPWTTIIAESAYRDPQRVSSRTGGMLTSVCLPTVASVRVSALLAHPRRTTLRL